MQYSECFTASQGFLESRGRLCWPGLVVLDNSGLIICLLTAELQHQTPLTRANSGSSGSTGQSQGSPGITSRPATAANINISPPHSQSYVISYVICQVQSGGGGGGGGGCLLLRPEEIQEQAQAGVISTQALWRENHS